MSVKKIVLIFFFCLVYSLYAEPFCIAVIPDTQNYTNYSTNKDSSSSYSINQADFFYNQMQYIANNSIKNGGNIGFAVHVGDHVSHWGKHLSEWERADKGMRILNDIVPFIVVPGNHDYDEVYSADGGSNNRIKGNILFSKYFGNGASINISFSVTGCLNLKDLAWRHCPSIPHSFLPFEYTISPTIGYPISVKCTLI